MQAKDITIREIDKSELSTIAEMSAAWENENGCYGYRRNETEYLEKFHIYVAEYAGEIIGYYFGDIETAENMRSIVPDGKRFFEIEELYIKPVFRSQGIGKMLLEHLETELLEKGVEIIFLSTATKDYKKILHFYIDEIGMSFWSARLFKFLK